MNNVSHQIHFPWENGGKQLRGGETVLYASEKREAMTLTQKGDDNPNEYEHETRFQKRACVR